MMRLEWTKSGFQFIGLPCERVSWDGAGLPPIGALVEDHSVLGAPVYMAEVVAVEDGLVALKRPGSLKVVDIHGIRPVRAPQQIAEEERLSAIAAMMTKVVYATPEDMARLYDAGYRKQPKG